MTTTFDRIRTARDTLTVAQQLIGYAQQLRARWQAMTTWQLSIDSRDRLFPLAARWVADQVNPGDKRPLTATLRHPQREGDRPDVVTLLDANQAVTITVDGHPVRALLGNPSQTRKGSMESSPSDDTADYSPPRLVLAASTRAGRDAVLAQLRRLAEANGSQPMLLQRNTWGDWQARPLPGRPLASVILRDGLAEELSADLGRFLTQEATYGRLGLPWHRGYVLHGPPGTGKSSLVRALATEHRLNVYYLALSGLKSDIDLAALLSRLEGRSILLIEDIDTHAAAHQRTDTADPDSSGVSLSGLLNVLDGLVTPHGLVTVITTNHIDRLDAALLRPGRADKRVHIDKPDADQVRRIIATFTPDVLQYWPTGAPLRDDLTTAALVTTIKEHLDDHPQAQAAALAEIALGITLGFDVTPNRDTDLVIDQVDVLDHREWRREYLGEWKCTCDGADYETKERPFLIAPRCPVHGPARRLTVEFPGPTA